MRWLQVEGSAFSGRVEFSFDYPHASSSGPQSSDVVVAASEDAEGESSRCNALTSMWLIAVMLTITCMVSGCILARLDEGPHLCRRKELQDRDPVKTLQLSAFLRDKMTACAAVHGDSLPGSRAAAATPSRGTAAGCHAAWRGNVLMQCEPTLYTREPAYWVGCCTSEKAAGRGGSLGTGGL